MHTITRTFLIVGVPIAGLMMFLYKSARRKRGCARDCLLFFTVFQGLRQWFFFLMIASKPLDVFRLRRVWSRSLVSVSIQVVSGCYPLMIPSMKTSRSEPRIPNPSFFPHGFLAWSFFGWSFLHFRRERSWIVWWLVILVDEDMKIQGVCSIRYYSTGRANSAWSEVKSRLFCLSWWFYGFVIYDAHTHTHIPSTYLFIWLVLG